jgi:uncharacterized cupin superfamily protein
MPHPIVTATPAELELGASPFPQAWVLDGTPHACAKEIARSRDGAMTTVVWSCSKGSFRWHYSVDEMVHLIAGEVFILDHTDTERRLGPGDTAFFPAGSSAVWRITQDVRKVAVCRVAVPRPVGFALRAWGFLGRSVKTMFGVTGDPAAAGGGLVPAGPASAARDGAASSNPPM